MEIQYRFLIRNLGSMVNCKRSYAHNPPRLRSGGGFLRNGLPTPFSRKPQRWVSGDESQMIRKPYDFLVGIILKRTR